MKKTITDNLVHAVRVVYPEDLVSASKRPRMNAPVLPITSAPTLYSDVVLYIHEELKTIASHKFIACTIS